MAPRVRHTLTSAEARYRALVDELKLLTMSFPHLRETVDDDDLPVSFLLKRGADRADRAEARAELEAKGRAKAPAVAPAPARRRKVKR